jgi:hypothetical protein
MFAKLAWLCAWQMSRVGELGGLNTLNIACPLSTSRRRCPTQDPARMPCSLSYKNSGSWLASLLSGAVRGLLSSYDRLELCHCSAISEADRDKTIRGRRLGVRCQMYQRWAIQPFPITTRTDDWKKSWDVRVDLDFQGRPSLIVVHNSE